MTKFYDIVALDIVIIDRVSCLSSLLQLYRKKCDLKRNVKDAIGGIRSNTMADQNRRTISCW